MDFNDLYNILQKNIEMQIFVIEHSRNKSNYARLLREKKKILLRRQELGL